MNSLPHSHVCNHSVQKCSRLFKHRFAGYDYDIVQADSRNGFYWLVYGFLQKFPGKVFWGKKNNSLWREFELNSCGFADSSSVEDSSPVNISREITPSTPRLISEFFGRYITVSLFKILTEIQWLLRHPC